MSYPPTEVDVISNDSLFSDSAEFEAVEKPYVDEEDTCMPGGAANDLDKTGYAMVSNPFPTEMEDTAPPSLPVRNALMKPRRTARKPLSHWASLDLQVPEDDPEDEFDIATAQTPVFDAAGVAAKVKFLNGEPDVKGEATNCFEEPGLLYRIVDRPSKTWAFYNDSRSFEVRVVCTFGKYSKVVPLDNTTLTSDADTGELTAEVTVYPGETELFIKGFVNGFTSKLRALPLSAEYYQARSEAQHEQFVQAEMDAVRSIAGDETDAERVLQMCLENGLPFVDLSFPPIQSSIEAGAGRPFKQLPWARPRAYVMPELEEQIRLFRHGVCPGDVEQGELGDCWFLCAVATIAETPATVMRLFRHPKGAEVARQERALGAYRVTFNKNGLWRSVIVDDFLPVVAGVPAFAHSSDPCELWPAILEKAFAKLHGSYAMIQSGDPMHALTDMTGFPAMRIDDVLAEALQQPAGGAAQVASRLLSWQEKGYQLVLTTPGKAPAVSAEQKKVADFSDQRGVAAALAGTGLLPGHAYTVRDVKEFNQGQIQLLCLRNPWVYGEGWQLSWAVGGPEWQQNGSIANICGVHPENNDASIVWMSVEDVLKCFTGGGVLFRNEEAFDARLPFTYTDGKPGTVFEISVQTPTDVTFILSNMDHRGMHSDEVGAAESDPNNLDYPPIMLSLAAPVPKETRLYHVLLNSSANATEPSDSAWVFLQAREIAMICHLEPSTQPYLLIPRLMECAEMAEAGAEMRSRVDPIHYLNDQHHLRPGMPGVGSAADELAVTLGIETLEELGTNVTISICHIDEGNAVFENFSKFPTDEVVPHTAKLFFQLKAPHSPFARKKVGATLQ